MRLTADQISDVLTLVHKHLGDEISVFVYGSRLDDARKGGDLDLLVEGRAHVSRLQRAGLKMALEAKLKMQVDVLVLQRDAVPTAFQALAKARAVALERPA